MAKEFARDLYKSRAWKDVRNVALERTNGLCARCLERGRLVPADIVHHKIPLTPENVDDPSIALNPDLAEPLCKECHEEEHERLEYGAFGSRSAEKRRLDRPRVGFDADGNVVPLP